MRAERTVLRDALVLATVAASLLGCTTTRFLAQATTGQLDLWRAARPLHEVLHDPATSERTRRMLHEVVQVKRFGARHGLRMRENYEAYVELERPAVVWFVNASEPLAFEPKVFWFPVVGSFPGLGWFDEQDARAFAGDLRREGWDVNVRPVTAYSTGGWFDDPVLSSMFSDEPEGLGMLANVLLHESVHATVLVEHQQYFNESLASFVANALTPPYLAERFGAGSPQLVAYERAREEAELANELLARTILELTTLYESSLSDAHKRREKQRLFQILHRELEFPEPPNNATLIGFALYHEGRAEMQRLRDVCPSWTAFLAAVDSLRASHFPEPQSPTIGPVFDRLTENGCQPLEHPPFVAWNKPLREWQRRGSVREPRTARQVTPRRSD